MGCDIHPYVEVKQDDGTWEMAPTPYVLPFFKQAEGEIFSDTPVPAWSEDDKSFEADLKTLEEGDTRMRTWRKWYPGRSYYLFSILAGVRNYDELTPISEPRGCPPDASLGFLQEVGTPVVDDDWYETASAPLKNKSWDDMNPEDKEEARALEMVMPMSTAKKYAESWGSKFYKAGGQQFIEHPDWHSTSWLLLSEILDWPGWKGTSTRTGIVSTNDYFRFKETGQPDNWCRGTSAEIITNEEMDRRIAAGEVKPQVDENGELLGDIFSLSGPCTWITWEVTVQEEMGSVWNAMIERMKTLHEDPSCVRLVFFFDN